jgi:hypothetical protein
MNFYEIQTPQNRHLVQLHRHPDALGHHLPDELHVCEHPLVADRRDPEVALEEGVETVLE